MKLLVFPLDIDACLPIVSAARALEIDVVGASSVMSDADRWAVDAFDQLPFVTDLQFDQAFQTLLAKHQISHVFTPHEGIWQHLSRLESHPAANHAFTLCKPDPFSTFWGLYEPHETWAAAASGSQAAEWIGSPQLTPPLSVASYAGLHRQFLLTPGQCDEEKLLALCDIARTLAPGDMLEIGSLWGRSAFALGYLAQRHRLGNLICIDPWDAGDITDQGTQAEMLKVEHHRIGIHNIFRAFLATAALLDNIGYIRATSEAAQPLFTQAQSKGQLDCPELGKLSLSPHIRLIHIDGNHRYDHVKRDVELWLPSLCPGGWLLLDDYVWAFGDGPRRVGDELLNLPCFDQSFVCADTLFLRKAAPAIQTVA